ncbi:hypothetical protein HK102_012746 [Quaeritorhiza haematococci]|nr:hypothetical protein HK102_012746 [Quaeritorhiza haematococci]
MTKPKMLFIVSSHDELGKTQKKTGWYLPEVAHPWNILVQHYDITVASPKGGKAPMDPGSAEAFKNDAESQKFLADVHATKAMDHTRKLTELTDAELDQFVAVVVPGGHGPMFDLPDDEASKRIIAKVFEKGGVVGAVCHGPCALVNVKLSSGDYLIKGKKVTGFTNAEEDAVELSSHMPFMLEDKLQSNGGVFSKAEAMWGGHVVVDGRLVTGQNPASATGMAEEIHKLLQHK